MESGLRRSDRASVRAPRLACQQEADAAHSIELAELRYASGSFGLQVISQTCHELVGLSECGTGLLRRFADEDLHAVEGAPSCSRRAAAHLIRGLARHVHERCYPQERGVQACERICRVEVVVVKIVRYRVLGAAMFAHLSGVENYLE